MDDQQLALSSASMAFFVRIECFQTSMEGLVEFQALCESWRKTGNT